FTHQLNASAPDCLNGPQAHWYVALTGAHRDDMRIDWTSYSAPGLHDELIGPGGGARIAGRALSRYLTELGGEEIGVRQQAAELAIKGMGITFTVYHEQE